MDAISTNEPDSLQRSFFGPSRSVKVLMTEFCREDNGAVCHVSYHIREPLKILVPALLSYP
jgi:hypothetical protein